MTSLVLVRSTSASADFWEREKRHFPQIQNVCSRYAAGYKPRGRRYIPHGYGFYDEWTPHNQNIQITYAEAGPDWSSRLKYIDHPQNPKYPAAEIFPDNWKAMRPYPYTYRQTDNEWLLDPGLSKKGMKCTFEGVHKATNTSSDEITHKMLYGRGRTEVTIDKRNGIPFASEGDKTYQAPEYSPGFHRIGSSLPLTQFGHVRDTFREIEKQKQKESEINVVRSLDTWKPATPLNIIQHNEELAAANKK